ncbi:MAG: helix-turn-helix transcriptional regulator [Gemmatimonadaceae bacterium]|nr:helix-turn-helix transcriptional regulator [Gemmatimonadaceae bacterium]
MNHRHLEVVSGTPAEAQPLAAVVDILQRGDLDDWRPIARAIRRDPMGEFADKVLRLVDAYPMYGTSSLWRSWIDRCRARAEGAAPSKEVEPSALRRRLGMTQVEVAGRMGISQSDLSKLERRRDLRLSTLRSYAQALGGGIRVLFVSSDGTTAIRLDGAEPSP